MISGPVVKRPERDPAPITLGPLGWADWAFCRRLASDPVVRANSRDPKPPTFWGHLRWMWRHIPGRRYAAVIYRGRNERVGIATASPRDDAGISMGIALTKEARGCGIGMQAIARFAATIHAVSTAPLYAEIKPDNFASISAFQRAGFRFEGARDGLAVYRYAPSQVVVLSHRLSSC